MAHRMWSQFLQNIAKRVTAKKVPRMWKRLFIMGEMNLAMVDTHTRMTVMKASTTLINLPSRTLAFTVSVCRACCSCWWSSSLEMRVWQDSRASCGQEGERGSNAAGATRECEPGCAWGPPRSGRCYWGSFTPTPMIMVVMTQVSDKNPRARLILLFMDRTSMYLQPWNTMNKGFTGRYFGFWPHCTACGILVPRPGIEPMPPALVVQGLDHWNTREVPRLGILTLPIFRIKCIKYWHLVEPSQTNQRKGWGPILWQGSAAMEDVASPTPGPHATAQSLCASAAEDSGRERRARGLSRLLSAASPGPDLRPHLLPRPLPRQLWLLVLQEHLQPSCLFWDRAVCLHESLTFPFLPLFSH